MHIMTRVNAVIALEMRKDEAELIFKALEPDLSSSERAKVTMCFDGRVLNFNVSASDTMSLRAAINTVLRQIKLVENVDELGPGKTG